MEFPPLFFNSLSKRLERTPVIFDSNHEHGKYYVYKLSTKYRNPTAIANIGKVAASNLAKDLGNAVDPDYSATMVTIEDLLEPYKQSNPDCDHEDSTGMGMQ